MSADGKSLAALVAYNNSYLAVVDLATGMAKSHAAFKMEEAIGGLAFTSDSSTLVTAHADGTIRSWTANELKKPRLTLRGRAGYIHCLQLSAEGDLAITDSPDATAIVWKPK